MSWRMDYRAGQRMYSSRAERAAFRAGYSDGYHGRDSQVNVAYKDWPNAYSAGYHEGAGDVEAP